MKKKLLAFLLLTFLFFNVFAQTNTNLRYQKSYVKKNGTVVQSHYKTTTNSTNHDNFSSHGNKNTVTGTIGYRAKDYTTSASNYGKGQNIYTGSKGGQYYYNSRGNKTYVPKR